jgi:hypothetical protein
VAQAIGQGPSVAQGDDPKKIHLRNRAEDEYSVDESLGKVAKKRKIGEETPEIPIKQVNEDSTDHGGHLEDRGDSTICLARRSRVEEGSSCSSGAAGQIRSGRAFPGQVGRYQDSFYEQTVATHTSSLETAMASTGLLLGNLARGLVEGAAPMIANIMAMHKVIKWFQKEKFSLFLLRIPSPSLRFTMRLLLSQWLG